VDTILATYISNPHPVWQPAIADYLIAHRQSLMNEFLNSSYSTAQVIKGYEIPVGKRIELVVAAENALPIYFEAPEFVHMADFYSHHGLEPVDSESDEWLDAYGKLRAALAIIEKVKPAYLCILKLVRCIQLVRSEHHEIDVSYSHPDIPYTIFVSVCEDDSLVSSLRVAESIIHEAMHLKLTLIESIAPLVKPDANSLYYSPWRDENRPAQGVLHGMFVFRAILDFHERNLQNDTLISEFLELRIAELVTQIESVKKFHLNQDLTELGRVLTNKIISNLNPLNNP